MVNKTKQKVKVVFSDGNHDIGITGTIIEEDDFFVTVLSDKKQTFRIGKKAILSIRERGGF